MTEMFGEAWSPMSVPDLAPDDDDDNKSLRQLVNPTFLFNSSESVRSVSNISCLG